MSATADVLIPTCQIHERCPYESYVKSEMARKKVRKMTFQIGLFGSDGMLLAGDTKSSESGVPARPQNAEDFRHSEMNWSTTTTKFMCKVTDGKEDLSMVIAQCGDAIARKVAEEIFENWERVEHRTIMHSINDTYSKIYPNISTNFMSDLLIVRHKEREMLHCTTLEGQAVMPLHHTEGKVITGRAPSLALLFVEKFLKPDEHTIEELKPIAAYTVWLTGQLNSNVEGLEMIEFPDNGPARRLTRKETKALESQAVDLHCKIKRALLG